MSGTLRVLEEKELGLIAGGSLDPSQDPNWMPSGSSYSNMGITAPTYSATSFTTSSYGDNYDTYANNATADGYSSTNQWIDANLYSYDPNSGTVTLVDSSGTTQSVSTSSLDGGTSGTASSVDEIPEGAIVVTASPTDYYYNQNSYSYYDANYYYAADSWSAGDVFFWYLPDTDIEDFKEFLAEDMLMDVDRLMVDTFVMGEDKYAVYWDGDGEGAVFKIHDSTWTDDSYTFFSLAHVEGVGTTAGSSTEGGNAGIGITLSSGTQVYIQFLSSAG